MKETSYKCKHEILPEGKSFYLSPRCYRKETWNQSLLFKASLRVSGGCCWSFRPVYVLFAHGELSCEGDFRQEKLQTKQRRKPERDELAVFLFSWFEWRLMWLCEWLLPAKNLLIVCCLSSVTTSGPWAATQWGCMMLFAGCKSDKGDASFCRAHSFVFFNLFIYFNPDISLGWLTANS